MGTVMLLASSLLASSLVPGPWASKELPPKQRAAALAKAMTLDEQLAMLHGPSGQAQECTSHATCAYTGNVAPNERLGIPPINMEDGPQGFRTPHSRPGGSSTAWPSGLTVASSWDIDLIHEWGAGMGREFYAKGANVQLGPGLCVARIPRNGRNFEYLSGEDPYLGFALVQPAVKGIQSQKVVANAKHWVLNNQETSRTSVDELASERTRFEMYYPPFAGAIAAGVGSVMCSYNKINGKWSCENPTTLAHDLKTKLGFEGYVMSDWGATHSTSIGAGLDVEMPGQRFMNSTHIRAAISAGSASAAMVLDSVTRILTPMFAVGVMDEPASAWDWSKLKDNVTTSASLASARRLSAASTVLLKNAGVLPLPVSPPAHASPPTAAAGLRIGVIGYAAADNAVVHAGGSGSVVPSHVAAPLDGIRAAAGEGASVSYASGANVSGAVALAASCDVAIVFVQTLSSEGADRKSLSLDVGCQGKGCDRQNALVEAIAAVNARTIVVMSVPGAVLTPWRHLVAALLVNFMPGQQAGNAIADVLFGAVNPSAKLPLTYPAAENETALSPTQWPGYPDPKHPQYANYSEGLLVGYRYYDARAIEPAYPFGHGLSYTRFEYSALHVRAAADQTVVSFNMTNVGALAGAEVAQLYLSFPPAAGEPPKVLRRFSKVMLKPGQTAVVQFEPLSALSDMAIWSETTHSWEVVPGSFGVLVGSSSRDIRLTGALQVPHPA